MLRIHKQHRNAFTLIELLVVIAIISILAAILFPVFARARENARRASCLSNLKQIGLGMMQYTQDYDEKFPLAMWEREGNPGFGTGGRGSSGRPFVVSPATNPAEPATHFKVSPGSGNGNFYTWMDFIFPYVKSVQLFVCPSFHVQNAGEQTDSPSYGYNTLISNLRGEEEGNAFPSAPPISSAAIERSSELILNVEFPMIYSIVANPGEYCSRNNFLNPNNYRYQALYPHMEGAVYTFADGHAKWYKRGASSICRVEANSTLAAVNQRAWNPSLP